MGKQPYFEKPVMIILTSIFATAFLVLTIIALIRTFSNLSHVISIQKQIEQVGEDFDLLFELLIYQAETEYHATKLLTYGGIAGVSVFLIIIIGKMTKGIGTRKVADQYLEPPIKEQAAKVFCPNCKRALLGDYYECPTCRTKLK